MSSIEDTIRRIVREEVRAALDEWRPPSTLGQPDAAAAADLLSLKAAAAYLGLTEAGLRDWRNKRVGPPGIKYGRLVMYRLADLEQWVADREDQRSRS